MAVVGDIPDPVTIVNDYQPPVNPSDIPLSPRTANGTYTSVWTTATSKDVGWGVIIPATPSGYGSTQIDPKKIDTSGTTGFGFGSAGPPPKGTKSRIGDKTFVWGGGVWTEVADSEKHGRPQCSVLGATQIIAQCPKCRVNTTAVEAPGPMDTCDFWVDCDRCGRLPGYGDYRLVA